MKTVTILRSMRSCGTTIVAGNGREYHGYVCDKRVCQGCPFQVEDVDGCDACYYDQYRTCVLDHK